MRILITGALGFLGSHITQAFLDRGDYIVAVDDLSGGSLDNLPKGQRTFDHFKFYQEDLANYNKINEIFAAHRPEVVYHLAANAREGASFFDIFKICRANTYISSVLLELGIKYGMVKLVFCSSMAVYGKQRAPFDESMRRKAADIYGAQKICVEEMIELAATAHPFEYTILRPHNLIGPNQCMTDRYRNVCAIFANSIMRGEPLYLYGKDHKRAFSYVKDALPVFLKAAESGVATGEIINIGGKIAVTVKEMAEEVIANFPEYKAQEIIELPARHGEVETAYATYKKSEDLLGFNEQFGWKEGVKAACAWFRQQGPKEWRQEKLATPTENMPRPWLDMNSPK